VPALQQPLGLSSHEVTQLLQSITSQPPTPMAQRYAPAGAPISVDYGRADYFGGPQHPIISEFPVVGAVLLSMFVPLFALIYYGMTHGNLPKRRSNDPGTGKAIGFAFIPIFSIYWHCFFWIRLCTRIDDERSRVGLPPTAPRSLVIAMCWCMIGLIVPFVNILTMLAWFIMAIVALIQIQTSLNELAAAVNRR
jgi:hypothetical protein